MRKDDESLNSHLAIQLSILEPLLLNQQNLELALAPSHGLVNLLIEICKMPSFLRRKAIEVEDQDGTVLELPVYIKQGLRCLTILV